MTGRGRRVVHRRLWTRDDRAGSVWHALPVEVPAGCDGLSVRLDAPVRDDVVLDLGCEGPAGWRGWSGGARREYAVTPSAATPGYRPGALEPGEWSVVLGLHRLPPEGVEVAVTIELGPAAAVPGLAAYRAATDAVAPPARPPRRELPAPGGMRWVACDFHAHTLHSDGAVPVADLAARGVAAGLDLLAVTDHNTDSHHPELGPVGRTSGIGLLAGQEVTTDSGHANAFGRIGWIDFRRPAADWVSTVAAGRGLLSINHPLASDCAWRQPLDVRPPLAEVWHSTWLDPHWTGPIAWWQAWGMDTIPVGGSDWHEPGPLFHLGTPTTWVCVDAGADGPDDLPDAVLAGLAAGRTAISAGRDAPVLLDNGGELLAVDAEGTLLVGPDGSRRPVRDRVARLPPARPGGQLLIDHNGAVIALAGVNRGPA